MTRSTKQNEYRNFDKKKGTTRQLRTQRNNYTHRRTIYIVVMFHSKMKNDIFAVPIKIKKMHLSLSCLVTHTKKGGKGKRYKKTKQTAKQCHRNQRIRSILLYQI